MILTEQEIQELSDLIERSDFFDVVVPFARAIEAAIIKKIGEPVAWHHEAIRQLIAEREDGKLAADRIEQLEAEKEKLILYKQLADEYGLSVFADLAELQKQRDELLAAAKFFMRAEGDYDLIKAGKLFQAAIASVKGGAA